MVPVRYVSADEDSSRWLGFPFRPGDIVVSARSKHGTTWMQTICAALVFGTAEFPAPLSELSPWLDWLVAPRDEVWARLASQEHRRVIKTHTPLDGIPLDQRAAFVVVARHPIDAAISLYHQGNNLDRARMRELTGQVAPIPLAPRPPLEEWLRAWIDWDCAPSENLDSLPGVMWHLSDAWTRRHEPNVTLAHYDDLSADLEGEMRRIANWLEIPVPDDTWPQLVRSAQFEQMRSRADQLVPDTAGVLIDRTRFFRRGSSGARFEVLSTRDLDRYRDRASQLAPADLLHWLHR
jgi:aryl sulfotransferase